MSVLLFPLIAISAPCTEADLVPGDNIGNCDSLIISNDVVINPSSGLQRIFITGITGNVEINANITIDGGNGQSNVLTGGGGNGPGAPGAHNGGGNGFGGSEDGGTASLPDGKTAVGDIPCASGGGGAGFFETGFRGGQCVTSDLPLNGGAAATNSEFDFTLADFRGGFGGGAGANGASSQIGAGGGGGGALHIETTGTITIAQGVTISARGGSGGNDNSDGGGGGAGSGGAIWLVSAAGISNKGTIDVRGGTGGRNELTGAHGGNGSSGRYRLESAGVITEGSGVTSPVSAKKSLNSDISCGTIAKANENNNQFFQLIAGFMLAIMFGLIIKILSRFQVRS